jgi:hypothetical protein
METDPKHLANLYSAELTRLEYSPEVDNENDVIFKHPGFGTFYISLDAEKDPEFMRIVFPNFADEKLTGGDVNKLLLAANEVNRGSKCAKIYIRQDKSGQVKAHVSASIECFVAGPDEPPTAGHLKAILERSMSALRSGVESFMKKAKESDSI